jgi:hypothetical protein
MFDMFKSLFTSAGEALYFMRIADAYRSQPAEMREALTKAIRSHYPITPVHNAVNRDADERAKQPAQTAA